MCLSLLLKDVQGALGAEGLADGMPVGACVRSVEGHGCTLSFGIKVRVRGWEECWIRGGPAGAFGPIDGAQGSGKPTGRSAGAFGPQDGVEGGGGRKCQGRNYLGLWAIPCVSAGRVFLMQRALGHPKRRS